MLSSVVIYVIIRLWVGDIYSVNKNQSVEKKSTTPTQSEDIMAPNSADSTDSSGTQDQTSGQLSQKSDSEFSNWVRDEAKNLEKPTNDPLEFERKTKQFVNQLTPQQLTRLKQTILNLEFPMNERIFSNYALMQFEGDSKNEVLKDLLFSPVPDFQDPKPHTEDEVRRGQEYSLRYMEIDELSRRAEDGDLQAREILIETSQTNSDLKIQNYAKRKLKEIRK